MMNQQEKAAGFTFTELVIVIAVIGVLSSIAVSNFFPWFNALSAKSAARDLYAAMQETRLTAINANQDAAIVFDILNNQYYLCDDPGPDASWSGPNDNTGTGDNNIVRTVDLSLYKNTPRYGHGAVPAGNSATGGAFPAGAISYANFALIFNSQGVGTGGYVYLEDQSSRVAYAVGTRTSGLVKMWRWNGGNWE